MNSRFDQAHDAAWDTWQEQRDKLEREYGDYCYAGDHQMQYELVLAIVLAVAPVIDPDGSYPGSVDEVLGRVDEDQPTPPEPD